MRARRRRRRAYLPVGLVLVAVAALGAGAVGVGLTVGPGAPLTITLPRVDHGFFDTGPGPQQQIVEPRPGDSIPAGHVPILMYHYIRINPNPRDASGRVLSVTPENFRIQMQWAHDHGFQTITMEQLYGALAAGRRLDRRTMVLTFDDGYADFYTDAWPVLKAYGFSATAYIVGSFPGSAGYMTWDQLAELDRAGIDIGAHSMTHPDLTKQPPAGLAEQISGSKAVIEQHLGHPVFEFCYPSGRFNLNVAADVRGAGFHDATTTLPGVFESVPTAMFWPRVRIDGADTLAAFTVKLATGVEDYLKYGDTPAPHLFPSPLPVSGPTPVPSESPADFGGTTE